MDRVGITISVQRGGDSLEGEIMSHLSSIGRVFRGFGGQEIPSGSGYTTQYLASFVFVSARTCHLSSVHDRLYHHTCSCTWRIAHRTRTSDQM